MSKTKTIGIIMMAIPVSIAIGIAVFEISYWTGYFILHAYEYSRSLMTDPQTQINYGVVIGAVMAMSGWAIWCYADAKEQQKKSAVHTSEYRS